MLHLELVQTARAAARSEPAELDRLGGIRHVEHLQAAEEAHLGAIASAHLDADDRDVVAGQRSVTRRDDDDILRRRAGRARQRRHVPRSGGVARVDDGDAVVGAEALLGAEGPVREAPGADVRVLLMNPHVGVEAAASQVVVSDGDHVASRTLRLGALGVDPLHGRRRCGIVSPGRRCRADRGGDRRPEPCSSQLALPRRSDIRSCAASAPLSRPVRAHEPAQQSRDPLRVFDGRADDVVDGRSGDDRSPSASDRHDRRRRPRFDPPRPRIAPSPTRCSRRGSRRRDCFAFGFARRGSTSPTTAAANARSAGARGARRSRCAIYRARQPPR